MSQVLKAVASLGLDIPRIMVAPPGVEFPFPWVRTVGDRVFVSGHGPLLPDGGLAGPLGKVGVDVSIDEARNAARLTALAMIASLAATGLDLDRLVWLRAFGMVNAAPGFTDCPNVINGFSDLIIAAFGIERGNHARSAVGMFELPFGVPVEIEADLVLI
mgnify:FL=1